MSDFHQSGPVTSLPRLVARPVADLETEILALTPKFPVSLVIPLIPAEMDRPALARILDELCHVRYLSSLVISLNKASREDYTRAQRYFERYPGPRVILWSESRGVQDFLAHMQDAGLNVGTPGKGRACWLAMGYLLAEEKVDYITFQDADVVTFDREMLARLILPALDPIVDYDFVKAYYARFSDRLHGRVTRLFVSPLLAAFIRLIGAHPYIAYLSSFRYALSGEFAVQRDLASRMRLPSEGLLKSLLAAYQREAEDAVADSYAVASLNGLRYDRHEEEINLQTFAAALRTSVAEFLADPLGPQLVPNWARVWAGVHEAGPELIAAVERGPD